MENTGTPKTPKAFLPDAALYNGDPGYITHLMAKSELSTNAIERLLGFAARSFRNYMSGKSKLSYTALYCLEALARGGIDNPPQEFGIWFNTKQRPVRTTDHGRLIVAKIDGALVLGRVCGQGYGVAIEPIVRNVVNDSLLGTTLVTDYVLLDQPDTGSPNHISDNVR